MKKIVIIVVLMIACLQSKSQTYVSLMPGFYTGPGTVAERTTLDVEVGRQWDVFSLGLDFGKTNLTKQVGKDTTFYTEIRPNLNVFQQGKFTNTLTIGLGYVFGAQQNILTEFSTGIEYTPNSRFSYNMYFGTYYFSGTYSASQNNFFGISAMYYFKPSKKKGLLNTPQPS